MSPTRKYCFVPQCTNSTVLTPNKHFFRVPMNECIRNAWWAAAKRLDKVSVKSVGIYCCQDHFEVSFHSWAILLFYFITLSFNLIFIQLSNDVENYNEMVGIKMSLKQGVVPHILSTKKIEGFQYMQTPKKNTSEYSFTSEFTIRYHSPSLSLSQAFYIKCHTNEYL